MPAGEKEAMTAQNFDENEYRDKLLDDDYSPETAKMLAAKKKEELNKLESLNGDEIDMIRWHRDQIMKLLGEGNLEKILYIDEL
jgi:hypothetical protein